MKGNIAAIALILLGAFFLLGNLGLINVSLADLFRTWWPVMLIVVGVGMFFTPSDKTKD